MNAENIPSPNELERLEKEALASKKSKSRDEKLGKEVREMVEQVKGSVKSEVAAAVDGLWNKLEPYLTGQERMSTALMDAFEEYVQNVAFQNGGESPSPRPSPNEGSGQNAPQEPENVPDAVPPAPPKEEQQMPKNGNDENGVVHQGHSRGHFRGGIRGRVKNIGMVRGGGRQWNGVPSYCHCWDCRRSKGWHGRGGGRGGAGSGFGHGGRHGFGRGQHQHMGPMHR